MKDTSKSSNVLTPITFWWKLIAFVLIAQTVIGVLEWNKLGNPDIIKITSVGIVYFRNFNLLILGTYLVKVFCLSKNSNSYIKTYSVLILITGLTAFFSLNFVVRFTASIAIFCSSVLGVYILALLVKKGRVNKLHFNAFSIAILVFSLIAIINLRSFTVLISGGKRVWPSQLHFWATYLGFWGLVLSQAIFLILYKNAINNSEPNNTTSENSKPMWVAQIHSFTTPIIGGIITVALIARLSIGNVFPRSHAESMAALEDIANKIKFSDKKLDAVAYKVWSTSDLPRLSRMGKDALNEQDDRKSNLLAQQADEAMARMRPMLIEKYGSENARRIETKIIDEFYLKID